MSLTFSLSLSSLGELPPPSILALPLELLFVFFLALPAAAAGDDDVDDDEAETGASSTAADPSLDFVLPIS